MFLPKPVYEALPCAYVVAGCICLYVVFGLTPIPGACWDLKSILIFTAGCILGGAGIVILSLRYQYRRNRTVFVKQPRPDTTDRPQSNNPQSL